MKKTKIVLIVICVLSFLGQLYIYPQLPDVIPTHWGISGEADGFSDKSTALFLALVPLILLLAFQVIPKIDPRGANYKKHAKAYDYFITAFTLFLVAITWLSSLVALGADARVNQLVPVGVGILFLIIGNYMPQIRSNYTLGVKTPWTIESEWVWKKTHVMGGIVFCILGILFILTGILASELLGSLSLAVLLISTAWLYLYSYLLYRKEQNGKGGNES